MIRILVCDDDEVLCRKLTAELKSNYGEAVVVTMETDAEKVLSELRCGNLGNLNIVLMDIRFEKISGIDVAKEIQNANKNVKVIFITSYLEYATQIFKARPSNFLLKPVKKEKLFDAVDEVMRNIHEENQECIQISQRGNILQVRFRDILYIESDKRIAVLHEAETEWEVYRKLNELEKELPDCFVRCHQSFLVNMNEIKLFNSEFIILHNGNKIDVSKSKYKKAREKFFDFIGENLG